ncbi:MAG: hypothetical protein M0D55_08095 [Elusimicrobiota bacterium]|nr:MAG: hypothetical protein M0D55_08095 [Elusimicrobiota bacterium]
MELTKRDVGILAALEKWGVMGLGQVDGLLFRTGLPEAERVRLFFNDLKREDHWGGAYKRLRTLVNEGMVRTFRPTNYWQVYMLTGRGHEQLRKHQQARFPHPIRGVGEAYLRHEITVCGVGLALTELLGLRVQTARQTFEELRRRGLLREGFSKLTLPDLLVSDAGGPRHAVEVELTAKSRQRYREMFRSRPRSTWGGMILYLTGWPTGREHIIHLAAKAQSSSIYAANLAVFGADPRRCEYLRRHSMGGIQKFLLPAVSTIQEPPRAEVAA